MEAIQKKLTKELTLSIFPNFQVTQNQKRAADEASRRTPIQQVELRRPQEEARLHQGGVWKPQEASGSIGSQPGGTVFGEGEDLGGAEGGVEGEALLGGAGGVEPETGKGLVGGDGAVEAGGAGEVGGGAEGDWAVEGDDGGDEGRVGGEPERAEGEVLDTEEEFRGERAEFAGEGERKRADDQNSQR